ncbi:hypothetical protein HMPREF9440_01520 [Sutterella parvirubra YIT 11816]|uniref:Uncharacterized protein n=1 Tax=Sutterella parvirubra YIT 11816 TaxID=762967 RepID=H3KFK2_9BURK|nr:hypothetical protein HMPREF9440_01520 [Sutterella parvirubra YIT 11816]
MIRPADHAPPDIRPTVPHLRDGRFSLNSPQRKLPDETLLGSARRSA